MSRRLKVGDKAPQFTFNTPWQSGQSFHGSLGPGGAALLFLRYIGCPVCQMDMARYRDAAPGFAEKGAALFCVLQSPPERIAALALPEDWPQTIVCDPRMRIFGLYGVEPGGFLSYINPMGLVPLLRAFGRGHRHGSFEGRETQLPAAFVIGPDKLVRLAHYGRYPADTPPPSALLKAL